MKASHNESRPCNSSYDNSPLTDFREQPRGFLPRREWLIGMHEFLDLSLPVFHLHGNHVWISMRLAHGAVTDKATI